jgi:hypothetical protein
MIAPLLNTHAHSRTALYLGFVVLLVLPVIGNAQVADATKKQMADIIALKNSFSAGEKKLSSNLAFASRKAQSKPVGHATNLVAANVADADGTVQVVIRGQATAALLADIGARGGKVLAVAPSKDRIEARLPLTALEGLASRSDVGSIRQPPRVKHNFGSVTTQGYITHFAKPVVESASNPIDGTGVSVGVLSDSASLGQIAVLQASGDLNGSATTLPGQDGAPGTDEGAAMMEIVQDLVPGAQVIFATAFTSESSFAQNIVDLNTAGCSVIVDDVSYSDEDPFEDSSVAQAVNAVVGNGAIYFSSAANSGNMTNETSTTWEGDFADGGTINSGPIVGAEGVPVVVHEFSPGVNFNALLDGSGVVDLFWADPLGGATDDYDLFVLDSTGTTIKGFSINSQNGTQDPFEEVATPPFGNYMNPAPGDIVVIARFAGKPVALHVESFGESALLFSTNGATHGHNAAANTQSIAASYWNSAHGGLHFFNANAVTETFSSDGPRRIFFTPDGTAITPGNFKFATNGGTVLQKPDFTGADGITARTPGFNPFFGTSAAAPHCAGVAALVRAANPALTNVQVHNALLNTVLTLGPPGFNQDSGFGIVRAKAAVDSVSEVTNSHK